jgi:hypothetical protein
MSRTSWTFEVCFSKVPARRPLRAQSLAFESGIGCQRAHDLGWHEQGKLPSLYSRPVTFRTVPGATPSLAGDYLPWHWHLPWRDAVLGTREFEVVRCADEINRNGTRRTFPLKGSEVS